MPTAPIFTGLATEVTFAENTVNAGAMLIDADISFTDAEDFGGGLIMIEGLLPEDILSIRNEGTGAGQIGFDGTNITYEGVTIGQFSGGLDGEFAIRMNRGTTAEMVDAVIENLTYGNASNTPTASRTLSIKIMDFDRLSPVGPAKFNELTGSDNPLNPIDVGSSSKPAFGDLDGDDLPDLLIGNANGTISYFLNTGTLRDPEATEQTGAANPLNGVDLGDDSTPALADLDHDGDLDLIVGESGGTIAYFKNTGTSVNPVFTQQTGSANPFAGIDLPNGSAPTLVDLDGDGDQDLVIGGGDGTVSYFLNTGSATAPTFAQQNEARNPFYRLDVGDNAAPSFGDIDNDRDLDAVIGTRDGTFVYLENAGSATIPKFIARTDRDNPLNGLDAGDNSAPFLDDFDRDGDVDAIAGSANGGFTAYSNDRDQFEIVINVTPDNDAPEVAGSSATTREDAILEAAVAPGSDVDGSIARYAVVSTVAKGGLDFHADGTYRFDPRVGFASLDDGDTAQAAFTYRAIDDGGAASATKTVTITMTGVNDAPEITTSALSVRENSTPSVKVAAIDPDDAPTFAIAGGADAGLFTINASSGVLSFRSSPDYEKPGDADGDNQYEVLVRASDGTAADTKTIMVTVANETGADVAGSKRADDLSGTDEDELIAGGNGKDVVSGLGGADTIDGGKGSDKVSGGEGGDSFVFGDKLKANVDRIMDFEAGVDRIVLDDTVFRKLSPGPLYAEEFVLGKKAKDGSDHVIYNANKGLLLYDPDGKGGKDAMLFAKVGKGLDLDAGDFLVA